MSLVCVNTQVKTSTKDNRVILGGDSNITNPPPAFVLTILCMWLKCLPHRIHLRRSQRWSIQGFKLNTCSLHLLSNLLVYVCSWVFVSASCRFGINSTSICCINRSDFLSLPFQAIECSLAGVRPKGNFSTLRRCNQNSFVLAGRCKFNGVFPLAHHALFVVFPPRRWMDWGSSGRLWSTDILCILETSAGQTLQLLSLWRVFLAQCQTLRQQRGQGQQELV